MTSDFERVRAAAARSMVGQALRSTTAAIRAAWGASMAGQSLQRLIRPFATEPPARRLQCCATAIAIAIAVHLVFRALMPATVVPALPAPLMLAVAALAAAAAWQADAVHRAWVQSALSRLFDRRDSA